MMKKNIVVVDDFENTRWIIEFNLKDFDANIKKAENGEEALRYFDGQRIDLLITDLNMPVMDGLMLVKKVKEMPDYKTLPVIMLSTEKDPARQQQARNLRITTWMQKPFKSDELQRVVKRLLGIR